MIEGGSNTLTQFIERSLWDEARIITSDKTFGHGLAAPKITGQVISKHFVSNDEITIISNAN
jgi:diaminohydroxyphosphoribosylaminopyrimidine deaminase/5-amino-6-(5-phosphoribosylamino)uracil reductase